MLAMPKTPVVTAANRNRTTAPLPHPPAPPGTPRQGNAMARLLTGFLTAVPSTALATAGAAGIAEGAAAYVMTGSGVLGLAIGSALVFGAMRTIKAHATDLIDLLQGVSQAGDLTVRLPVRSRDELGQATKAFNDFLDRVNQLIWLNVTASQTLSATAERLSSASAEVALTSQQVTDAIAQSADGSSTQAQSITEGARDLEALSRSAERLAESAEATAQAAVAMASHALAGREDLTAAETKFDSIRLTVGETADVIRELGELGDRIGVMVDMIKAIASQTNLLSLNAAIEAARAGDHGRGFAVVADEVRKLAAESARSAEAITAMAAEIRQRTGDAVATIGRSTGEVTEGAALLDRCSKAFDQIVSASEQTSRETDTISREVAELAAGLDRLAGGMETMSATSEQMAAAAQQVSASAQEQSASVDRIADMASAVAAMSQDMTAMVDGYRTAVALWNDSFATEIALVDEQHQTLFDAINRFGEAIQQGKGFEEVDRTLQFLLHYTKEHFSDEEDLMREHGYPDLAAHKAMHATFVKKVQDLIETNRKGDVRAVFKASTMLVDWLQKHIREVDIKGYTAWIDAQSASRSKPVAGTRLSWGSAGT